MSLKPYLKSDKALSFLMAVIAVVLLILTCVFCGRRGDLVWFPAVLLVVGLVFFVSAKLRMREVTFIIALFALSFILKLAVALSADARPESDFRAMYDAAIQFKNGDFSFAELDYFRRWAYQTGFVIYQGFIMSVFGEGTKPLLVMNCLFLAGSNVLVYKLARLYVNERASRVAALLYLIYPAAYTLAPVLTNQHLSTFLILLASYLFLQDKRKWYVYALGGAAAGLGNVIRPVGIVFVTGVIIFVAVKTIANLRDKEGGASRHVKRAVLVVIPYLLIGSVLSFAVSASGVNPNGLTNTDPLWKLVCGLNYDSDGRYTSELSERVFSIEDDDARHEYESEIIREHIVGLMPRIARFTANKAYVMWAEYENVDFGFQDVGGKYFSLFGKDFIYQSFVRKAQSVDRCFFAFMLLLYLIAFTGAVRKKRVNDVFLFTSTIMLIYIGSHFLIEVQPRYREFLYPFLFVSAAGIGDTWRMPRLRTPI